MEAKEGPEPVFLHVYDLTRGLAADLSPILLGKQINGVWHTALVVGGTEYYYGGGIQQSPAGSTPFGQPLQVIHLGNTEVPADVREELIHDLGCGEWRPEKYDLFRHNCNHFSNELSLMLTGQGIPEHIVMLPEEVLSTPFGQMIAPMLVGPGSLQDTLGSVRQGTAQPFVPHLPLGPALPTPLFTDAQSAPAGRQGAGLVGPPVMRERPLARVQPADGPALESAHDLLEIATAVAALEEAAEAGGFPLTPPAGGAFRAASSRASEAASGVVSEPGGLLSPPAAETPPVGGKGRPLSKPPAAGQEQPSAPAGGPQVPSSSTSEAVLAGRAHIATMVPPEKEVGGAWQKSTVGGPMEEPPSGGALSQAARGAAGRSQGFEGQRPADAAAKKVEFDAAVRTEFAKLMAVGSMTANEAAIAALQRVKARSVSCASPRAN
eukprot:jgi/Botrbrau1/4568/Bobra.60_2s0054.1